MKKALNTLFHEEHRPRRTAVPWSFGLVLVIVISVCLFFPVNVFAATEKNACGEGYALTLWSRVGNPFPTEENNVIGSALIKKRWPRWSLGKLCFEPFASLSVSGDRQNFDWNNRAILKTGFELRRSRANHYLETGVGYVSEHRFQNGIQEDQLLFFFEAWKRWGAEARDEADIPGRTSGSFWIGGGNQYPTEPGNATVGLDVQQAITLKVTEAGSFRAVGKVYSSVDSEGFSWNNRAVLGLGLKFYRSKFVAGYFDVGMLYQREWRFEEDIAQSSIVVYLEIWQGWHPS